MSIGALSNLKVVEYSQFISGPYCGKLIADLGAEVIKVEKPGFGDRARSYGPFLRDIPHPERSGLFLYLNTNKLGVTLDVRSVTGKELFKELVKRADILVENNSPQEMEELGLDYESLHEVNPRLVVTSITPFGQTGPYRDYKACDLVSLHISGTAYVNPLFGVEDPEHEPPLKVPAHQGDFIAGLSGALGTMSAAIAQQVTGLGQHVDLSEQDALASMARQEAVFSTYEGYLWKRARGPRGFEMFTLLCRDGYVAVNPATDQFWASLVEMMGNPDWTKSELCQDRVARRTNWNEIELLLGEWTREHTTEEVSRAAQANRIPCMPVYTAKEVVNAEQLEAREFFVEVEHKEAGKVKYPGAPYKLSGTPWSVNRPAPLLGEHNVEVYCGVLGYTKQDLVKMRQAGVI